ncbi:uncharacterized protein LOC111701339 isoform X2 [Eurytemora carolleeae]|uniref:uncharacterized protein LOC111701339 isoform X2 n=1 Tax=Eurytemora carolleeae TaxID=1294199 RepID=UPI000C792326|nr:uncharacterized protein LOC111701339 isoform X2 [Eurytemora carolleeae]|eukprot:XP_023328353.1 uncharacterized protein LOC111701339 isoform X2 [Eurytemora affinis]
MLKTCFLLFFFGAQSQGFLFRYPWHASCSLKWRVAEPCEQFKIKMINQIRDWEGDALCPGTSSTCPALPCGQRCLYDFVSVNGNEIKATHTTPVARYIDDLTFKLTSSGGACIVDANSNSRLWYAVLDKGTNYCNLRNLVDGAGYTETSLTEETNDGICTQYTSRDCSRF